MPGSATHELLTRLAIACLSADEQAIIQDQKEALCHDYCMLPDVYYADAPAATPYLCFVDGVPFHYIPNEPVEYNNWKVEVVNGKTKLVALPLSENVHHRHCRVAFEFYFSKIARSLADHRLTDAAKFGGALSHALEDNCTPIHAFEGSDGVDVFVLDRLVRPPADRPLEVPSVVFAERAVNVDMSGYTPRLLGTSPAEASFHLYTRFCETVATNRFQILPILEAAYAGKKSEEEARWVSVHRNTICLLADVWHTAIALSRTNLPPTAHLEKIDLAKVRPARRPRFLSSPYKFTPFVGGFALDENRKPVPLVLEFADGSRQEYATGLGLGSHATFAFEYQLPAGVFRRLRGAAGLHADLGRSGHVRLEWRLNDKVLWEQEFGGKHLAEKFDLDVSAGGWLVLRGHALTDVALADENNLVLGEPVLERSPRAPTGLDSK